MSATVELWRAPAAVMHGMVQAAATDRPARDIWSCWIQTFTERATPTLNDDTQKRLGTTDVPVEGLTDLLVGLTFDAMQRDVRSIVETDLPTPHLAATLAYVWERAIY